MKLKKIAKEVLPKSAWNFLRHYHDISMDIILNRGARVCKIPYSGFTLCYGTGNALIKKIRGGKIFEKKMCESIVSNLKLKPQSGFLDIGANIGLISLYVHSKLPAVKIFAFEPGPHQAESFFETIKENHLNDKIILEAIALGNKLEKVAFMTHFSQDCSGDGLVDTNRAGETTPVAVQMSTLDSWYEKANRPQVGVVKIDTEGAELWVLQGGEKFISETKPIIYLEIEPKNLAVYPYTREDILKWFNTHQYELYTLGNELCTEDNFKTFVGKYDTYVAHPKK